MAAPTVTGARSQKQTAECYMYGIMPADQTEAVHGVGGQARDSITVGGFGHRSGALVDY
jgi:hypothetical protein